MDKWLQCRRSCSFCGMGPKGKTSEALPSWNIHISPEQRLWYDNPIPPLSLQSFVLLGLSWTTETDTKIFRTRECLCIEKFIKGNFLHPKITITKNQAIPHFPNCPQRVNGLYTTHLSPFFAHKRSMPTKKSLSNQAR